MSNAGRPRKPTELKKIQGTYRKDRDYGEVEADIVSETPPPPNSLNAMAKREWLVVCQWLFDNNLLAQTDLSLLAIYCTETARYWELDKAIKKHQKIAFSTLKFPPAPVSPVIPMDASEKERKRIEKQYRSERFDHQATIVEMREEQAFHLKSFRELTSLQSISSQKARDYGIQFGFTPAARTKIKPAEKKSKSALEKLLEKKHGKL